MSYTHLLSGAGGQPLLSNEVHFHEDDAHFDRFQRLVPAFGRGRLTSQSVARIIFRVGLDVAEALMLEADLAIPAPQTLPAEQFELWDEFLAQARDGAGRP
jgi:hypothetical protein